jgi:DNA-3-methyladenine glycosylase II
MSAPSDTRRYLARRDPRLKVVLDQIGVPTWTSRAPVYEALLESILSQQLSVKAAATIHRRFLDLFPHRRPDPRRLARMSPGRLRAAGVSRQKAGYLRDVARFALRHDLGRRRLGRMSDEEIVECLTRIKGVGRWTVEMLLMFNLGRPDVFPVDDLGIRQTMIRLYRIRAAGRPLRARLERIAEAWRPFRSYACFALWRWKDGA